MFQGIRHKRRVVRIAFCLGIAGFHGQGVMAQTAADLADGVPWSMTGESGPNGELVMFPDGTGRMKARGLSLRMTWTMQGDRLCIKARIRGTQCARLIATAQGFRAEQDGQTVFTLSR